MEMDDKTDWVLKGKVIFTNKNRHKDLFGEKNLYSFYEGRTLF